MQSNDKMVRANVSLSRRDRAILYVLAEYYGTSISEVVRMVLRQKIEQLPNQLNNELAFFLASESLGSSPREDGASDGDA